MRVLIVDVNCKSGSTGKIAYDLYAQLRECGDEAAVAYGRGATIDEPDIHKFSSDLEVKAHALLTRLTGRTACFSPFATAKLLKLIKAYQPNVIHLHDMHGYFVNIKPLVEHIKANHIKAIWTFHSEFMYTGKCGISLDCERWKSGCGHCPYLREYPSSLLIDCTRFMHREKERMFEGFYDLTIVTPSQWLADRVHQSFLQDKRVKVIHNGIDTTIYHPRDCDHLKDRHQLSDEKVVLSVAPNILSKIKGGQQVLELARRMQGHAIKFILIGVDDLNQRFDDNVIALGRTENQDELAGYYTMADAFLMCSQRETFSLTCAEALCCGTRVVGYKSGAPETIFQEPYAYFVEQGNIEALERTLLSVLNEPLKPSNITEYGRSNFDKKRMFEQYDALYRDK